MILKQSRSFIFLFHLRTNIAQYTNMSTIEASVLEALKEFTTCAIHPDLHAHPSGLSVLTYGEDVIFHKPLSNLDTAMEVSYLV